MATNKVITDISTAGNDVNISDASFYIESGGTFLKLSFDALKDALINNAVIDDDTSGTDNALSAAKIYELLADKRDSDTALDIEDLSDGAKTAIVELVKESVPVIYDMQGELTNLIDDTQTSEELTYSSSKIDTELAALKAAGLAEGSVKGVHLSDDAMETIVAWIKEQGISFETIYATSFKLTNISDPLVLFSPNTPFDISVQYIPSNATAGKQLLYTPSSSNIAIENDTITVSSWSDTPTSVTAALVDDETVRQSFEVLATKTAFTADFLGIADESVSSITSSNNTGITLGGDGMRDTDGYPALCADDTYYTYTLSELPAAKNSTLTLTAKFRNITSETATKNTNGWIQIDFPSGSWFSYGIQNVDSFQGRLSKYCAATDQTVNDMGGFMCDKDSDGNRTVAQSGIIKIVLDTNAGTIKITITGYSDNDFAGKTNEYNGITKTINLYEDDSYTADDFTGFTDGAGNVTISVNKSQKFNCSLVDLCVEYS